MQYITLRQTLSSKQKEQGYFALLEKNTRFVREQLTVTKYMKGN